MVVIGVGHGWSIDSVSCLVDDTTTQIIEVNNFTDEDFDKVREYTDDFSCQATISLKGEEKFNVAMIDNNNNNVINNIEDIINVRLLICFILLGIAGVFVIWRYNYYSSNSKNSKYNLIPDREENLNDQPENRNIVL